MPAVECLELIQEDVTKFNDMLENPAMFSEINPYWDAEDYIGLHESFYLLEPMEEKWGKWVSWKCMCESSLKVLGNFIHFPWPCLIHASLAGAWR